MSAPNTDPPKERRADTRHICHRPCLVRFDRRRFDGRPGRVGAEGALVDLSACGLGLLLRSAVPLGTTLAVSPLGTHQSALPLACVVHCVLGEGRWYYGCGLARRLREEELSAWLT